MNLLKKIEEYYKARGLMFPDFDSAIKFAVMEIGEVLEVDIDRRGIWVRNNPQNKPKFDRELLSEELGDAIMMLLVAGISEGVDPIQSLLNKMERKMAERSANFATKMLEVSDQPLDLE